MSAMSISRKSRLSLFVFVALFVGGLQQVFANDGAAAAEAPEGAVAAAIKVHNTYPGQILGAIDAVAGAQVTGCALEPSSANNFKDIQTYANNYRQLQQSCGRSQASASALCMEKSAPEMQKILGVLNTAMSTINMSGVMDACSKLGQMSQLVNTGLTAYTAACSAVRSSCTAFCGSVKKSLTKLAAIPQLNVVPNPTVDCSALTNAAANLKTTITSVTDLELKNEADTISIGGKSKLCSYDYGQMVASATTGIIQMINSANQAKACKQAADGTGQVDKCADPKVAETDAECICRFYPRSPGCTSSQQAMNAEISSLAGGKGIQAARGGDLGPMSEPSDQNVPTAGGGSSSSSDPTGGAAGGSGSFGGTGGGGSGSGGEGGGEARRGLNANIVNGFSGGGGGGAGYRRSSASDEAYRAYLPGGKKDPKAGMAGQELWKKEVTAESGKSNWDKVRERYRDNRSTLLNN